MSHQGPDPQPAAPSITITGTGFVDGATVQVGGRNATNVVRVSATELTATTPSGQPGSASLVVTNPDQGVATASFTYISSPTVTSVSPASGDDAGATQITITGTGFIDGAAVTVGGSPATDESVVSGTRITAVTPSAPGSCASTFPCTVNVTVTNSDSGTATLVDGFTYVAVPPEVDAVSPSSGPLVGGNVVTLTGARLPRRRSGSVRQSVRF
ncbi:MAG: IPT/TIG domain-containing protein [Candidatus Nanopelagicales bacterium]